MSLTETLTAIKTNSESLLSFANQTTGNNDPDLGEAVKTLCDGFGGGCTVEEITSSGNGSTSITFTGLSEEPKSFIVQLSGNINASTTRTVVCVSANGSATYGLWSYQSSNKNTWCTIYWSKSYFNWTYLNGTLTVRSSSTTNGGIFRSGSNYGLIYTY